MEKQIIRYSDLSTWLKISVVSSLIIAGFGILAFVSGIIAVFLDTGAY
jgi:hypothetical protein